MFLTEAQRAQRSFLIVGLLDVIYSIMMFLTEAQRAQSSFLLLDYLMLLVLCCLFFAACFFIR